MRSYRALTLLMESRRMALCPIIRPIFPRKMGDSCSNSCRVSRGMLVFHKVTHLLEGFHRIELGIGFSIVLDVGEVDDDEYDEDDEPHKVEGPESDAIME